MNLATPAETPPRSKRGPVSAFLGSVLLGRRPEDKAVQKRTRSWLAWLSGGGFAIYVAIELLSMVKVNVANERQDHREDIASLVSALRDLTTEMKTRGQKEDERFQVLLQQLSDKPVQARPFTPKPAGKTR